MKKQYIWILVAVVMANFVLLLFSEPKEDKKHPTLNEAATMPDEYLKNVKYYEEQERHEMSAYSLGKAIAAIYKLEGDVDSESFQMLENSVDRLEEIHKSILLNSLNSKEMSAAFEFSLNNLVHAELEISEMYAETNHMDQAKTALKYAQLHIKNAMLFHDSYWDNDSVHYAIEKQVFLEMDSLLKNESFSPMKYSLEIDKMIKQGDEILKI